MEGSERNRPERRAGEGESPVREADFHRAAT